MNGSATDTIFAMATAPGPAAVAIVRASGPAAAMALERIAGKIPQAREARLARLRDPATGETIDRGLILFFPGPASATGEDLAEFHIHGGGAVIAALGRALACIPTCRPATRGEFTRRAFEKGKLDLSAAEGIADLIAAETEAQRRQALAQAGGSFARLASDWTRRLTHDLAYLEAAIDFADEELPGDLVERVRVGAATLHREIAAQLADGRRGEILRAGLSVAIIGPPNSGKSSLLNALAGREAAIVSASAGTTRDVIEVHLDLDGYPIILADTAGLRESQDPIEAEGIRRARARAEHADLALLVLDATLPSDQLLSAEFGREGAILVLNKGDLVPQSQSPADDGAILVSAATGEGLDLLVAAIAAAARQRLAGEPPAITRARHRLALEAAVDALERAQGMTEVALIAEDLRLALRALGRITGRVDVEDLLDVIFGEFCLGK